MAPGVWETMFSPIPLELALGPAWGCFHIHDNGIKAQHGYCELLPGSQRDFKHLTCFQLVYSIVKIFRNCSVVKLSTEIFFIGTMAVPATLGDQPDRGIDPRLSSANRSLFPMSTAPDWTCESPVPEPPLYIHLTRMFFTAKDLPIPQPYCTVESQITVWWILHDWSSYQADKSSC